MESLYSLSVCEDEDNYYDSRINLSSRQLRNRPACIAEIDEMRINPMVSKKGYLNFLEEKSIGWVKKFVVICCLFFFFDLILIN